MHLAKNDGEEKEANTTVALVTFHLYKRIGLLALKS